MVALVLQLACVVILAASCAKTPNVTVERWDYHAYGSCGDLMPRIKLYRESNCDVTCGNLTFRINLTPEFNQAIAAAILNITPEGAYPPCEYVSGTLHGIQL